MSNINDVINNYVDGAVMIGTPEQREESCKLALIKVLKHHSCVLEPFVKIVGTYPVHIESGFDIVAAAIKVNKEGD